MWNALKNAMFEGEDQSPSNQKVAPSQAVPPQNKTSNVTFSAQPSVNAEMVNAIRKQTFSRNTALTALIGAADQLSDIIPDPVMRLKAAQKTAGAGRAAKEFADAVQIHLNDVEAAEMSFAQALDSKIKNEVGGLQTKAAQAEKAMESMNTEIHNLTNRISQLTQQVVEQQNASNSYKSEAAAKEAELNQASTDFKAAADVVRAELNQHKTTILSTLG